MEVRGLRVGALLVPLGVSLVPISVLLWYGLVRIPEREAYLNERNHRLLMTLGGEIKKKVDSFDGALDNAAASFDTNDERQFQVLVQQFSTELSIVRMVHEPPKAAAGPDVVSTVLAMASDPPRVTIEQDEGRSFLYLGAALQLRNQERVWVAARADVDRIVRRRLEARSEFDAIYLTTQLGEVIAQRSPVGVALSRIDSVLRSESDAASARTSNQPSFASISEFSNMAPVTIGEAAYKLYLQPIPLSLLGAPSDARAAGGERHPAQWVLCGLVRADRFRAESAALSYTTLLWFSAALALMTLAIPFLKLRALRPRERLQAGDAGWVTIATFAGIGLVTFGVLDVLAFGSSFERLVDARLSAVATQIQHNLTDEVKSIRRQTAQFDSRAEPTLQLVTRELGGASSPALVVRISGRSAAVSCDPQEACDRGILEKPAAHADSVGAYPFFYLVSWIGDDGWQRMKWTPGHADGMTPFINIRRQRLPYYSAVDRAWRHAADGGDQVAEGVSVLQSPNIGEPLTVFWLAQKGRSESFATFAPISLDQPMLPEGVAFAVVDRDGQTLFHSDASRRLQENFFKECRDNSDLRGAVAAAYEETFSLDCTGQPMRLHVAPLVLDGLQNPHWSLLVFQPAAIADTVNLEALTLAASMFVLYGIVLGIAALLLRAFAPDRATKWFWPDPRKRRAYVAASAANALIVVVFLAARLLAPRHLLPTTAALVVVSAVATYRLIVRDGVRTSAVEPFSFWHPFFWARAAFLLVIAGLPAIACFQTGYAIETALLATNERDRRANDAEQRDDRIDKALARIKLDATATRTLAQTRRSLGWDLVRAPLWPEADDVAATAPGILESRIVTLHRSYGPVAIDLAGAARSAKWTRAPDTTMTAGVMVGAACALFAACYLFVWALVRPLFVLDVVGAAAPPSGRERLRGRTILVGPPGSGKSARLRSDETIRVFDVAALAYVERRQHSRPVPIERRNVDVAAAAAVVGAVSWHGDPPARRAPAAPVHATRWADGFDYATVPAGESGAIAIDHLDHRLDEPGFALQTLTFLERTTARGTGTIRIACDREPLRCLQDAGAAPAVLDRWARALRTFRSEVVPARDLDGAADPAYEAIWRSCSVDERLALAQLADEELVNPQSVEPVRRLVANGLIVRDACLRIANDGFRRFVLSAASREDVRAWERAGVQVPWASIEVAIVTVVVGLAGLLVLTQDRLIDAWIGFVPTLFPAMQKAWKLVASMEGPAHAADA